MKRLFHSCIAKMRGKNLASAPKEMIVDQMLEPRPLPVGKKEFEEWSDRIIAGALLAGGEDDKDTFIKTQKAALATMMLHLGPTESHKPDAYFIHSLRKGAVNQIAHAVFQELQPVVKARTAAKDAATKAKSEVSKG